ncbi:hypothetical protein E2C01_009628 [Portunus trituberculatus]|uniref:Uncharacterized protein n=1 Tax=Portunus trituberculatus TaxID=210409 RepID=A0A5B7D697_PORTR|nr:hypothetical protein [Portunus trituberculatus]
MSFIMPREAGEHRTHFPDKEARYQCWDSRDKFWACIDSGGVAFSHWGAVAQCHHGPARRIEAITPLLNITMGPAVPGRARTLPSAHDEPQCGCTGYTAYSYTPAIDWICSWSSTLQSWQSHFLQSFFLD